jgi:hypothetical protein
VFRVRQGQGLPCGALARGSLSRQTCVPHVQVMLPFVRTVHEQIKCLSEMARHGLKRGEKGLQVTRTVCDRPSLLSIRDPLHARSGREYSLLLRPIERSQGAGAVRSLQPFNVASLVDASGFALLLRDDRRAFTGVLSVHHRPLEAGASDVRGA